MASSTDPRVIVTRRYPNTKTTDGKGGVNKITGIVKSLEINLNSASLYRSDISSRALIRTPSSPSSGFHETSEFSHSVKAEPVGSPTTCLFEALTDEAQQVPSPQRSALTDTVVDPLKMEGFDWSPLPSDLFEVLPFATSAPNVNVFDEQPAVFPDRRDQDRMQLDTPQPQVFIDTPQPWPYPTVAVNVQQQQQQQQQQSQECDAPSTSADFLNLDSLSGEEIARLLAETAPSDDQAVFVEQDEQQSMENDQPVDPLLDHDYVEADGQVLAEFLDTTKGFFEGKALNLQIAMGSETIDNEDESNFLTSTVNFAPLMQQLLRDETEEDENSSAEDSMYSPSTSSRPASVVQRGGDPYYRNRRDRNNEASRKSRANRKAKFDQAKKEVSEQEERNRSLLADVARLEAIRDEWKEKLLQLMGSR